MRTWPAALVLILAACSAEPAAQTLHSDDHTYHIDLSWLPADPSSGELVTVTADVRLHQDLAPVTGADVSLEPWMPMHDHGIPDAVVVTEIADGVYEGSFAFSMPGSWELRIGVEDEVATGTLEVR